MLEICFDQALQETPVRIINQFYVVYVLELKPQRDDQGQLAPQIWIALLISRRKSALNTAAWFLFTA